ncbi:MAG: DUF2997 domain-containing protein [Spirochaetes bacterium]|nr:DUF2997 domain-containing protein [Spirochaetota bacterium]
MAEHRIEITIDQDGKINAKTDGIKGEVCLEKVQELLGDLADLESYDKTDEWFQTVENKNTVSKSETIRRG